MTHKYLPLYLVYYYKFASEFICLLFFNALPVILSRLICYSFTPYPPRRYRGIEKDNAV